MSTATATLPAALHTLGAIQPSPAECAQLDRDGYLLLPNLIDPAWLTALRTRFDTLAQHEGAQGGKEVHTENGTQRLSDLVNKGTEFDGIWQHPRLLGAMWHILGEFRLSSLNAREALPGEGHQGLHADWGARQVDEPYAVANSMWILDEFTGLNGSTRIVPGTHLLTGDMKNHLTDGNAPHPHEIILRCPAGSVAIFNAHCWHGGTRNVSGERRRVCHAYFTRRDKPQQSDQAKLLRPTTAGRLNAAQRWILDA